MSLGRFPAWTRNSLPGLFCLFMLSDAALACVGLIPSMPGAAAAFAAAA